MGTKVKIKLSLSVFIFMLSSGIVGLISNATTDEYYNEQPNLKDNITPDITVSVIDTIAPEIILIGEDITINENDEYFEPGYQAIDNIDGDITYKVEVSSNVDNKVSGTYTITYSVSDSAGNETQVTRNVIVKEKVVTTTTKATTTTTTKVVDNSTDSKIGTKRTFKNTITTDEEINNYIKELNTYLSKYKISVGYVSLNNDFTYLYNEKKSYFGASLIKTIDAMYVYENNITNSEVIAKVKKLISVSDNSAHAYLKDYIGVDRLKSYSKSIGVTLKNCNDKFYCDTTVIDQLNYLTHLYKLINTLPNGHELESYYINNYHNHLSFDKSYTNIHKYGDTSPYFHDVGIFKGDNPYMIVVLTSEKSNKNISYDTLIGNISKKINELNNLVNRNINN